MKKVTVAPLLAVRRGTAAIEFYKTAFGAVEKFRTESPDGAVVRLLAGR
jgi:PhnB protein